MGIELQTPTFADKCTASIKTSAVSGMLLPVGAALWFGRKIGHACGKGVGFLGGGLFVGACSVLNKFRASDNQIKTKRISSYAISIANPTKKFVSGCFMLLSLPILLPIGTLTALGGAWHGIYQAMTK